MGESGYSPYQPKPKLPLKTKAKVASGEPDVETFFHWLGGPKTLSMFLREKTQGVWRSGGDFFSLLGGGKDLWGSMQSSCVPPILAFSAEWTETWSFPRVFGCTQLDLSQPQPFLLRKGSKPLNSDHEVFQTTENTSKSLENP